MAYTAVDEKSALPFIPGSDDVPMEATVIRGEELSDGFPNVRRAYIPNPPAINMAFGDVKVKGGLKRRR